MRPESGRTRRASFECFSCVKLTTGTRDMKRVSRVEARNTYRALLRGWWEELGEVEERAGRPELSC